MAKNGSARFSPRDIGLRSDSFVEVDEEDGPSNRIVANIEGPQKSGKDHFALTAPGDIVIFNHDMGIEGVVEKFRKGLVKGQPKKRIVVCGLPDSPGKYPSYHVPRPRLKPGEKRRDESYLQRTRDLYVPVWERFENDMAEFLQSEARTGIVDTGGAAYTTCKLAFSGLDKGKLTAKEDPFGQKSGMLKAIFARLVGDGLASDKNVLWLHRIKEDWVNNQPSGKFSAAGYPDIAYECMVTIRTKRKVVGKTTQFTATVMDCRRDFMMNGEEFEDEQCKFSTVMASIYGNSEEEWE